MLWKGGASWLGRFVFLFTSMRACEFFTYKWIHVLVHRSKMEAREKVQASPWKTYEQACEIPLWSKGVIATWRYLKLDPIYYGWLAYESMLAHKEEVFGFCSMYFLSQISKCQTLRKFWHNFRVWKNALSLANRHTNISFYEWCSTLTLQGRKNWRNPVNLQIDTVHKQSLCLIHSFWLHTYCIPNSTPKKIGIKNGLKGGYPVIFAPKVFHIWFRSVYKISNSYWFCIHFWIKWELWKTFDAKMIGKPLFILFTLISKKIIIKSYTK